MTFVANDPKLLFRAAAQIQQLKTWHAMGGGEEDPNLFWVFSIIYFMEWVKWPDQKNNTTHWTYYK